MTALEVLVPIAGLLAVLAVLRIRRRLELRRAERRLAELAAIAHGPGPDGIPRAADPPNRQRRRGTRRRGALRKTRRGRWDRHA